MSELIEAAGNGGFFLLANADGGPLALLYIDMSCVSDLALVDNGPLTTVAIF